MINQQLPALHLGDAEGEGLSPGRFGNALEARLAPVIDVEAVDRNTLFFELVDLRLAGGRLLVCRLSVPRFSCFAMFRASNCLALHFIRSNQVRARCVSRCVSYSRSLARFGNCIEHRAIPLVPVEDSLSMIPLAPEGDKQDYRSFSWPLGERDQEAGRDGGVESEGESRSASARGGRRGGCGARVHEQGLRGQGSEQGSSKARRRRRDIP